MKSHQWASCVVLFVLLAGASGAPRASCYLQGTTNDQDITGVITFTEEANTDRTSVQFDIKGVGVNVASLHGIHIHEFGDIASSTDATSTGGHFIGEGLRYHGCPSIHEHDRHAGDFGNIQIYADGTSNATKSLVLIPLVGSSSIIGRAVVLHSNPDDCSSVLNGNGNAGSRLATCVIGIVADTGVGSTVSAEAVGAGSRAICALRGPAGSAVKGTVWVTSPGSGQLDVVARIEGLVAGSKHGFHIHQFGDISAADGSSTGSHFNPKSANHGVPNNDNRHAGDLGNIQFYDDAGIAWYSDSIKVDPSVGLSNIVGRSIVLHRDEDDGCSQPAGESGSKIAYCVLGIANEATFNSTFPAIPASANVKPQEGVQCQSKSTIAWVVIPLGLILIGAGVGLYYLYRRRRANVTIVSNDDDL